MGKYGDIVKSLDNAMLLVEIIADNKEPMALKELAAVTHIPKSTLHGYLSTLRKHGLICQDENGYYMLGNRMFRLGMSVFNSWDFVQLINPVLTKLTTETGLSSMLSVVNNDYLMNVSYYPSPVSKVLIAPFIGTEIPLHATAQGKIFLSGMEEKKIRKIAEKGLHRYTNRTITDVEELLKEIEKVKKTGVAFVNGEYKTGNQLISVPVRNDKGKIIYALSVMEKIEEKNMSFNLKKHIETLRKYADIIEQMDNVEFENRM